MSGTQTASAVRKDLAALAATHAKCRFCGTQLRHTVANLGMSPMANAIRKPEDLNKMEPFFPLHAYVCGNCYLVQLEEFQSGEAIFSDYAYFSSYVQAMLDHGKRYADEMTERFKLGPNSKVVEVAANDGYLLRWFLPKGVPVLGVEPAANVAEAGRKLGIPMEVMFFGRESARKLRDMGHAADQSCTVSCKACSRRPASATAWPASRKARATARPMPLPAPVMMATGGALADSAGFDMALSKRMKNGTGHYRSATLLASCNDFQWYGVHVCGVGSSLPGFIRSCGSSACLMARIICSSSGCL